MSGGQAKWRKVIIQISDDENEIDQPLPENRPTNTLNQKKTQKSHDSKEKEKSPPTRAGLLEPKN